MSAGTLFVVATPIGNLEDITLRALRVLREAGLIAAEDTRRTARLLAHHGITTPTLSFHEHNARTRVPQLIDRLSAGERIALVTDAGTPGVSDPGAELVRACVEAGIPVDPVPGVSAALTAAVATGFPLIPLTILGFPPARGAERQRWIGKLGEIPHTVTVFEAPHRIERTLRDIAPVLGNRQIVLGRELTKVHQEFRRGTAAELVDASVNARGEMTLVISPIDRVEPVSVPVTDDQIAAAFGELAGEAGVSRREAVARVAEQVGRSSRDVYAAIERVKKVR